MNYWENQEECAERRIDSDLSSAADYAMRDSNGFRLEDIAYVLASVMGENDGPSFWWLIAMKDHTYAVVDGSCDYTGWDCQAGAGATIYPTLLLAINALPEKESEYDSRNIKESVLLQLNGHLAIGEVKQ